MMPAKGSTGKGPQSHQLLLHMCVRSSNLHKGTSEAPELGLALAHPQRVCQLQAAGAAL